MTTSQRGPGRPRRPDGPDPAHAVRVPQSRWDQADRIAKEVGTDLSKLINAWLAWYGHEENAKAPRRPPVARQGE